MDIIIHGEEQMECAETWVIVVCTIGGLLMSAVFIAAIHAYVEHIATRQAEKGMELLREESRKRFADHLTFSHAKPITAKRDK